MIEDLVPIAFGWALGLLSVPLTWSISNFFKKRSIKSAIIRELSELQFRLVGNVFAIHLHIGSLDKEIVQWMLPLTEKYTGSYPKDSLLKNLKFLSEASNEQLTQFNNINSKDIQKGLSLKKFSCVYLETQMGTLNSYNAKFQQTMAEIRAQLQIINEIVENTLFYHRLTFDSSLSTENHNRAVVSVQNDYVSIAQKAKQIATLIENLANK